MNAAHPAFGAGLYTASLAIETAAGAVRALLVGLLLYAPTQLLGGQELANLLALSLGFGPVLLSVAAAAGAPGGALERHGFGARDPSERERRAVRDALHALGAEAGLRRWYVIDAPSLHAFVIGDVLYLHRELLHDPALTPTLAHELGHLASSDGRLTLALRRFTLTSRRAPGVLAGGLCLRLLGPLWLAWWRQREFLADAHAAQLGQGDALAGVLERTQLLDAAVPYMRDRAHPYHEARIERLQAGARQAGGATAWG